MKRYAAALREAGCSCFTSVKGKAFGERSEKSSLEEWTAKAFKEGRLLVFIGASGIAVRAIAPQVKTKKEDPAVIVSDEKGRFVIPLLSGHLGGANRWARFLSERCGGEAVITTATDINGKFSVDTWAKERQLAISDMTAAREISAALLRGETVGVMAEKNVILKGPVPGGLKLLEYGENRELPGAGIFITWRRKNAAGDPFETTLRLIPEILYLGIGCRRGTERKKIEALVKRIFLEEGLEEEAVAAVASIDMKRDEKGIEEYAESLKVPFVTFSSRRLEALGEGFTPSELVRSVTGVDNVCERSAMAAAEDGRLIVRKQSSDGVTAAVAAVKTEIEF